MRTTLRRSCDACAKAKHSCDLRTPRCTRCVKRAAKCVYANVPLTSSSDTKLSGTGVSFSAKGDKATTTNASDVENSSRFLDSTAKLLSPPDASFDPFDSYPPTRLPREHVQRLIYHCEPHLSHSMWNQADSRSSVYNHIPILPPRS